ncbi:MAG: hypothetical protein JXA22_03695 [Candidatus Thermoplasmatota archaeon]|nr:hypothetical protein [Candidatus Thermoplasmatota archaeon]
MTLSGSGVLISMRYGDKDGFNEIYDDNGELVLHTSEKALVVEENIVPTFKSTWRYYGGEYLMEPSKGTIYLTNERLVFINIPERMFAIGGDEARAVSTKVGKSFELGDLSSGSAVREYFEIPNIEVMASERKEGVVSVGEMVNLYVLSSGNQYHLSMVLPSDSDLLNRLMNKRVDNLDQLVNNLKDYFQKDDWMFTEAEKSIHLKPAAREFQNVPASSGGAPDTEADFGPSTSTTIEPARSFDPKIPFKRLRDRPGQGSVKYFQTLYRKGLIKDEIYRTLMGKYGMEPATDQESNNDQHPSLGVDVGPSDGHDDISVSDEMGLAYHEEREETDEELLNILNDTLSDFTDEPEESVSMAEKEVSSNIPEDEEE